MTAIHDDDGNEIADMTLSEKQDAILKAGEEIVVIYHTPQLLRTLLGEQNGTFVLRKNGDRITTANAATVKKFADLQRAIKAAREQRDA